MNKRSSIGCSILLFAILFGNLLAPPVDGQTSQPRKWKKALPGYRFSFPRDHAGHDEFKTEWWYFTGHLASEDGRKFGYEITFFRIGRDSSDSPTPASQTPTSKMAPQAADGSNVLSKNSKWSIDNFYPAHFALTDLNNKKFYFFEKLNRKGLGLADARVDSCFVFNERWSLALLGDTFVIKADEKDLSLNLALRSKKAPVVHGKDGVSQKASCAGCASHYYSMTRLLTEGLLIDRGKAIKVKGTSWMDHEFGSNQLSADQVGWDWFSIQLSDGRELMLYLLRKSDGSIDSNSSGTLVSADGQSRHLKLNEFAVTSTGRWKSPQSGGNYPMGWKVSVSSQDSGSSREEKFDLTLNPLMMDQELRTKRSTGVTYWEGAVDVSGTSQTRGGKPKVLGGEGYVEMTGYSERLRQKI